MAKHPKLITTAINVGGAFIAFNQGITKAIGPAMAGDAFGAGRMFVFGETGLDVENGQVQVQQTTISAVSKLAAVVWVKTAKYFAKRFRF